MATFIGTVIAVLILIGILRNFYRLFAGFFSWFNRKWHEDDKQSSNSPADNTQEHKSVSEQEIKKIYQDLVKKYHPDFARGEEDKKFRTELTAKLNNAYQNRDIDTLRLFQ